MMNKSEVGREEEIRNKVSCSYLPNAITTAGLQLIDYAKKYKHNTRLMSSKSKAK